MVAVTAQTNAATALTVMRRHGVRHLPVAYGREYFGLLTESDLLRALIIMTGKIAVPVGQLCRVPAPTVAAGTGLATTAAAILAGGSDAVLVVKDAALVGIVTSTDVLAQLAEQDTVETEQSDDR
jgi:CBS domain-containing protein